VEEVYGRVIPKIPAGRIGNPRDVAECIVFLCSKAASYVNGAALDVGGGLLTGVDWAWPF